MKLYFYFLDTYGRNPKGLCVEEREAKEKPRHTRLLMEFFQTAMVR